jgi:glycosyltransferase involved in cell wall biosynthesis
MNILLTHVAIGRGGDAVQWSSLAEAFRLTGHQVSVAGASAIEPYQVGSPAARLRTLARRLPWWVRDIGEIGLTGIAIAKAWRIARRAHIDVVIHRAGAYELMAPILARILGAPVIVCLDTHVPAERGCRSESYWRWLHERTMVWAGRTAALMVTPSEALRAYYHDVGIPQDRLVVRCNGVFERHLRVGEEAVRSAPPMARRSECVAGFVGSLAEWHRVDLLLDALALLASRHGPVAYRLVVIGTGRQDASLRAHAARRGVSRLVEWRGPLPHDRAIAAMREFDVAVLPSTLPTGAPMKLMEYAAMGRPIVAPSLPNIRDLFDPEDIVLVEPDNPGALADAIAALAADPARARRIGRAAWQRAHAWTWEATARALVAAVRDPVPGATRPPAEPEGARSRAVIPEARPGRAAGSRPSGVP